MIYRHWFLLRQHSGMGLLWKVPFKIYAFYPAIYAFWRWPLHSAYICYAPSHAVLPAFLQGWKTMFWSNVFDDPFLCSLLATSDNLHFQSSSGSSKRLTDFISGRCCHAWSSLGLEGDEGSFRFPCFCTFLDLWTISIKQVPDWLYTFPYFTFKASFADINSQ